MHYKQTRGDADNGFSDMNFQITMTCWYVQRMTENLGCKLNTQINILELKYNGN